MKVNRHGKPAKAYTDTLREPKKDDYQRLVNAVLEALIAGKKDVCIAFPYVFKFPADFPKGVLEEKVDDVNIRRCKAKKLLDWLREHGHTEVTTESLRGAMIRNGLTMAWMDEMCDLPVADWDKLEYNGASTAVNTATVGTDLESQ